MGRRQCSYLPSLDEWEVTMLLFIRKTLFLFLARVHHSLNTLLEFQQNLTFPAHSTNSGQEHSSNLSIHILPYQNYL